MNGGGRAESDQLPDPGTQTTTADNGKANPTWKVWGVAYPPCGRRRNWLWIVKQCPACQGAHHHRGGPDGGVRRAGCGDAVYDVVVRAALGAVAA